MRSRWPAALLLGIGLCAGARSAAGHAELVSPRPRTPGAQKINPPCGGIPRGAPVALVAGSMLEVRYKETIDHPGYYRIAFSPANDQGFEQNILANNLPDIQNAQMPSPHNYSTMVRVPQTPCTACTLQLIQYMTESTPPTLYYSCADIQIALPPASDAGLGDGGGDAGEDAMVSADAAAVDGGGVVEFNPRDDDGDAPSFCSVAVAAPGAARGGLLALLAMAFALTFLRRRR